MKLNPLALNGAFLIIPEQRGDNRGFFARCFSSDVFRKAGLVTSYPEWSLSHNARRGTVRGLHWQAHPNLETKLVQCTRGAIYDVIVDLRPHSQDFGKWIAVELSERNRHLLYVPAGFAHGFQSLEDQSEVYYHISEVYRPESARGVRWNDSDLAIDWHETDQLIISERDANLPFLSECRDNDGVGTT
ncbi:MAG: dTDP-4-dehydrorhamnose 3,5-epimerase [Pseudomonadota bacterium]